MTGRACVLMMLAFAWAPAALGQAADETAVPRISAADLKRAADAGEVLIVDVRDARSYADGHLPGALHIALDALPQKLAALKAAKKGIVTYCS